MALTKPSAQPYNPDDDLNVEGTFYAVCSQVKQGLENKQFPKQTNVAIEFTVNDDRFKQFKGKKAAIVCIDSVYKDKKSGKESHFLQYARMMGYSKPEQGVDPDTFLDKWYMITTVLYNGKAMVRSAIPMPSPTGGKFMPQVIVNGATDLVDVGQEEIPF